jgi:hypothetical protein
VKAGTKSIVVHTTSGHLFWDQTRHQWIKAAALHPGDRLRASSGRAATVVSGSAPAGSTGWMWDLTVPGDHDFYIQIAAAAVLVHNCDINDPPSFEGASRTQAERELADNGWENEGPTTRGGGVRWRFPGNKSDQIRFMPGNPDDPNIIKQGPYIRLSIRGVKYGPFRLSGF